MTRKRKRAPIAAPSSGVKVGHSVLSREEDAKLLYAELLRIAETLGVQDVQLLDKQHVYEIIEADPQHPLRTLGYDWDDASAARKHRIAWTGRLIAGLRIVPVSGPAKKIDTAPVYYYADRLVTPTGEVRRGHVHRDQLAKHDPSFVSVVHKQVEQIRHASARLGHILRCNAARRGTWSAPWDLEGAIVAAFGDYDAAGALDHAAEE